jgi:hypothetical protein
MMPVPYLPWPANLFSLPHLNVAADSTAPLMRHGKRPTDDHLCVCGCKKKHHMAVSGLEGESGVRRVLWFATMACKNKHLGIGT